MTDKPMTVGDIKLALKDMPDDMLFIPYQYKGKWYGDQPITEEIKVINGNRKTVIIFDSKKITYVNELCKIKSLDKETASE